MLRVSCRHRTNLVNSRDVDSVLAKLSVGRGLEARRVEFARAVVEARLITDAFAEAHDWQGFAQIDSFHSVEVYASQRELWERVIQLENLPADARLPTGGFAASIIATVLVAIIPEEYNRLRPEYNVAQDAWVRLLAHEMIHQLHLRIVGDRETAMGPRWFYEAFAIRGAGQHLAGKGEIRNLDEALSAMQARGRGSYARFEQALLYFERRVDLKELVCRAAQENFEAWLRSVARE